MLLANGILSDVDRRRVYTSAYRSLRHPMDQDPFGGGSTIIPSAFAAPKPSPDPNGQGPYMRRPTGQGPTGQRPNWQGSNKEATHDEGYADDGARARWRERKADAEAEQRPGFVRSSRARSLCQFNLASCSEIIANGQYFHLG